jgi:hypothetical protein
MQELLNTEALCALIDRYCDVWSEPEEAQRRTLLSAVWARGATYTDPIIHAATTEELLSHITTVLSRRPGAKVRRTSTVDVHHNVARFAWQVVQADGSTLPEGLDIAWISSDGQKLERIIGFFGPIGTL